MNNEKFYNKTIFGTTICFLLSTIFILINHVFDITSAYMFIIAGYAIGTLIADVLRSVLCKMCDNKYFKRYINDMINITNNDTLLSIKDTDMISAKESNNLDLPIDISNTDDNVENPNKNAKYDADASVCQNINDKSISEQLDLAYINSDEHSIDYIEEFVNDIYQSMKNKTEEIVNKIENTDYGNDACCFLKLKKNK